MLLKLLVFIAVIAALVYFFWIKPKKDAKNAANKDAENFVECEKCGTFISVKDAVLSEGKYVCKECLK